MVSEVTAVLTRPQQILLKRAQAQAGVDDDEYRLMLGHYCGVQSSTDPAMTDEQLDLMLAYLEAIYWRAHDAGHLPAPCNRTAPFVQRGYWAAKNPSGNTSRDRYNLDDVKARIAAVEAGLSRLGCGPAYFAAIRARVIPNAHEDWLQGQAKYLAALEKTLAAKLKKAAQSF